MRPAAENPKCPTRPNCVACSSHSPFEGFFLKKVGILRTSLVPARRQMTHPAHATVVAVIFERRREKQLFHPHNYVRNP